MPRRFEADAWARQQFLGPAANERARPLTKQRLLSVDLDAEIVAGPVLKERQPFSFLGILRIGLLQHQQAKTAAEVAVAGDEPQAWIVIRDAVLPRHIAAIGAEGRAGAVLSWRRRQIMR